MNIYKLLLIIKFIYKRLKLYKRCLYNEYNEIFTRKNNIERNDVGQGRDFSGVFSIENETPT